MPCAAVQPTDFARSVASRKLGLRPNMLAKRTAAARPTRRVRLVGGELLVTELADLIRDTFCGTGDTLDGALDFVDGALSLLADAAHDPADVRLRLFIRWHAAVFLHRAGASVVRRQHLRRVATELLQVRRIKLRGVIQTGVRIAGIHTWVRRTGRSARCPVPRRSSPSS